ncbi:hypothetical protein JMJ55_14130 [Belnapia sp. T6]|uniref:Uracil DNA glycosylase superfamily protein n=1 Tax=Belnapia mucosa TaxID=2804532 RepID=A0ABS1V436_9PROT|nr:hypothetical protein [Belnapia mucosa]MBL6456468.1 hypothetical protein [Belnapia mucosa]
MAGIWGFPQWEGQGLEPPEVAPAVEAWRQAWRPDKLRLLLLAESHMAGSAAELAMPLQPAPGWPMPAGFVRHLYCPAYGEPSLAPGLRPNAGTPQYWRLLAAAEGSPAPTRAGFPDAAARLAAKRALLERLRQRGIWLTDASLVAVAGPGGQRLGPAAYGAALRESWHRYHAALLPALDPAAVLVIGLSVARVLRAELNAAFLGRWTAVPQPMGARGAAPAAALLAALAEALRRHAPLD